MELKINIPEHLANESEPISFWFELSYAQFLTVPRLALESMPLDWQRKMGALLDELDSTLDWRPKRGRYWVRLRDREGRFYPAEHCDYRRGSISKQPGAEGEG